MAVLGTKKFWKPAIGDPVTQKDCQILKNSGYINIQLFSVNYMSKGNFWQDIFGGSDKIALSTNVKFQMGSDAVESTTIQDLREVKTNKNYILGLQRNISVKIPAYADALQMDVQITAVQNDLLQSKLDMLNKPEFQSALQLAPVVVGQLLTITNLSKKLLSDSSPVTKLEASFAGIISSLREDRPVDNAKLTRGILIMISNNEGDSFSNADETKFQLRGDSLYYDNSQVENTYAIFIISFEPVKGDDERSNWFKKYTDAVNNLDKIQLTDNQDEIKKIYIDSKTMWIEGNALLDADITYINTEKLQIKSVALQAIQNKYKELSNKTSFDFFKQTSVITPDIVKSLTGHEHFESIKKALPCTSEYLETNFITRIDKIAKRAFPKLSNDITIESDTISKLLESDVNKYINDLKENNIELKFLEKIQ